MTARPALKGIHHVKLAVSDLDRSLDFYERALGAERIPQADHHSQADGSLYAYIVRVLGLGALLELRLNSEQAERHRGFDPLTIAVENRAALSLWGRHLDEAGIRRSDVITSIQAWLIAFDDPDGLRIRLYTLETHGPELQADEDNPWVR